MLEESYMLIAADLVPTNENYEKFKQGKIIDIMDSNFSKIWYGAKFRLFNLETPISKRKEPFAKAGTFLRADEDTINGIKELKPDLICLANNHIMDFGKRGAYDTINLLNLNNIPHVGFGENLNKMNDYYEFNFQNRIIGIYNCCEHEFSYADNLNCGTNPFNPLTSLFRIQELKKNCDFLIVIYHGGKELYQYCTPKLKEICHSISTAGADLIVCQHSHCISCFEEFNGTTILYGQGNFIFDLDEDGKWNSMTKDSILVKLNLIDFSIDFIEFTNKKTLNIKQNQTKTLFYERSKQIKDDILVKERYLKEIKYNSYKYFRQLLSTKYLGAIDKRLFNSYFMKKRYKQIRLLLINYLDCEVHIENILSYLKEFDELYKEVEL